MNAGARRSCRSKPPRTGTPPAPGLLPCLSPSWSSPAETPSVPPARATVAVPARDGPGVASRADTRQGGSDLELEFEFTFSGLLDQPLMVGDGPFGSRAFFPVKEGRAKGARINGSLVGGGGDWLLLGADGFGRLDVRGQIQTADGAIIYISYHGLLQMTDAVMAAATGAEVETRFEDQYFRTAPRLETGDERYRWVNQTMFAAQGRFIPGGVEYDVYRLA
ncbi:MAG TPA: DUF3237 family protein [Acidimicrobiales bacterium]|nr:DUF3237 family protein [Acidimicrobiales bacterium]